MKYEHIVIGTFISRPNRFIACADTDRGLVTAHVKNTGRCRELLIPGAKVILEYHPDAGRMGRKTEYDLISVYKGDILINMDSQAPNRAAWEWLTEACGGNPDLLQPLKASEQAQDSPVNKLNSPVESLYCPAEIRREVTHGDSRFDLAFLLKDRKGIGQDIPAFMEVKGVTLEDRGVVRFPDAPTERGLKHIRGLMKAVKEGYEAYLLFVVQMKGIAYFEPNRATDPALSQALKEAGDAGVHVLAVDCVVTVDSMVLDQPVEVRLE